MSGFSDKFRSQYASYLDTDEEQKKRREQEAQSQAEAQEPAQEPAPDQKKGPIKGWLAEGRDLGEDISSVKEAVSSIKWDEVREGFGNFASAFDPNPMGMVDPRRRGLYKTARMAAGSAIENTAEGLVQVGAWATGHKDFHFEIDEILGVKNLGMGEGQTGGEAVAVEMLSWMGSFIGTGGIGGALRVAGGGAKAVRVVDKLGKVRMVVPPPLPRKLGHGALPWVERLAQKTGRGWTRRTAARLKSGKLAHAKEIGTDSLTGRPILSYAKGAPGLTPRGRAMREGLGTTMEVSRSVAIGTGAAMATSFFVLDPHTARMANFVQEYAPNFMPGLMAYLANDAENPDSAIEGRFKMALEELVLGTALEGMGTMLYAGFKARRAFTQAVEAGENPLKVYAKQQQALGTDQLADAFGYATHTHDGVKGGQAFIVNSILRTFSPQITKNTRIGDSLLKAAVSAKDTVFQGDQAFSFVPHSVNKKTGQYAGAPGGGKQNVAGLGSNWQDPLHSKLGWKPEAINSEGALSGLRQMLSGALKSKTGLDARFWYRESGVYLHKLTGGDMDKMDKLAQIVAITSPANKVHQNFDAAWKAMQQYEIGGDAAVAAGRYPNKMRPDIIKVMEGEPASEVLKGRLKETAFYSDIISSLDPNKALHTGTVDMWMARMFGIKHRLNKKGKKEWAVTPRQYEFIRTELKNTTDTLNLDLKPGESPWTVKETQAALWAHAKYLVEGGKDFGNFKKLIEDPDSRWLHLGRASMDFTPTSGHFPEFKSPPGVMNTPEFVRRHIMARMNYAKGMNDLFINPSTGSNEVFEAMGIPHIGTTPAPGGFSIDLTESNIWMTRKTGGLTDESVELIDGAMATHAVLAKSDVYQWWVPLTRPGEGTKARSNSYTLDIGRDLSEGELRGLKRILGQTYGPGGQGPRLLDKVVNISVLPGKGAVVHNWDAVANTAFREKSEMVARRLFQGDEKVEIMFFERQGNRRTNDWTANKNGQNYYNISDGQQTVGRFSPVVGQKIEDGILGHIGKVDAFDARIATENGWTPARQLNKGWARKAATEQLTLYQDVGWSPQSGVIGKTKGSTTFFEDGTALMKAWEGSNATTALHEPFHIARRRMLNMAKLPDNPHGVTAQLLQRWEDSMGIKGGKWTRKDEEVAANMFERYLYDGDVTEEVGPVMQEMFQKMAEIMRGQYSDYAQFHGGVPDTSWMTAPGEPRGPIRRPVSPEAKEVFDVLVTRVKIDHWEDLVEPVFKAHHRINDVAELKGAGLVKGILRQSDDEGWVPNPMYDKHAADPSKNPDYADMTLEDIGKRVGLGDTSLADELLAKLESVPDNSLQSFDDYLKGKQYLPKLQKIADDYEKVLVSKYGSVEDAPQGKRGRLTKLNNDVSRASSRITASVARIMKSIQADMPEPTFISQEAAGKGILEATPGTPGAHPVEYDPKIAYNAWGATTRNLRSKTDNLTIKYGSVDKARAAMKGGDKAAKRTLKSYDAAVVKEARARKELHKTSDVLKYQPEKNKFNLARRVPETKNQDEASELLNAMAAEYDANLSIAKKTRGAAFEAEVAVRVEKAMDMASLKVTSTEFLDDSNMLLGRMQKDTAQMLALLDVGGYAFDKSAKLLKKLLVDIDTPDGMNPRMLAEWFNNEQLLPGFLQIIAEGPQLFGQALSKMKRRPHGGPLKNLVQTDEEVAQMMVQVTADLKKQGLTIEDVIRRKALIIEEGEVAWGKNQTQASGWGGVVGELWYNGLLSGLKTHAVNFLSNGMTAAFLPLEQTLGRAFVRGTQGHAMGRYMTMIFSTMDALRGMKKSFLQGTPQLDPAKHASFDPGSGAMTREFDLTKRGVKLGNKAIDEYPMAAHALNWLFKKATIPVRALGAGDEFFKQINYRAIVKEELYHRASKNPAMAGDEKAIAEYIESEFNDIMVSGTHHSQRSLWRRLYKEGTDMGYNKHQAREYANATHRKMWNPEHGAIANKALEYARYATYTTPASREAGKHALTRGVHDIGQSAIKLTAQYWPLRLMAPFINTPTNLIAFYLDRQIPVFSEPFRLLKRSLGKQVKSRSPEEAADAIGRMMTGGMIMATAYHYAMSGKLVGGMPKNTTERRALEDAGMKPYSFRLGDKWISYGRLDPYASMLGTVADFVTAYQNADGDEGLTAELEEVGSALMYAMLRNLNDKTYVSGMIRAVQMIGDPERYSDSYAANLGATVVPAFAAQWVQSEGITGEATGYDPYMREVTSVLERIMSRIPGLSDNLEPRRNFMGEPVMRSGWWGPDLVSPFAYGEVSNDLIRKEVARLGKAPTRPEPTKYGVINLREYKSTSGQSAYDRWQELHSEVTKRGRTLKEALVRLINSSKYDRMPDFGEDGNSSPRRSEISSVVSEYREEAWDELLKEFPVLADNVDIAQYNRNARSKGRAERQLLKVIER